MRKFLLLVLLLATPNYTLGLDLRPRLDLLGPGDFLNLKYKGQWNNIAVTNASAHFAWSVALPLTCEKLWGRKGLWRCSAIWIAGSFIQEAWFHGGNPSEQRTDIISKCTAPVAMLTYDLIKNGF